MKDTVLIIDCLNFIYRGVIKFNNKENNEANINDDYTIVYNFFRNLRASVEQFSPSRCFLALEGNPSFRKKLFPEYKKNRIIKSGSEQEKIKNNVLRQANIIYDLVSLLPISTISATDFEADDVIFSLASNLKNEKIIIISSDSDLIQIIQVLSKYDIKLFHPGKKLFIEAPRFSYLVWKSIAGDKSDNIPAIASATKAELYSTIPSELKSFLSNEEIKANFLLNKKLIELSLIPDSQMIIVNHSKDYNKLFEEFKNMNFSSFVKNDYREKFINTFELLK